LKCIMMVSFMHQRDWVLGCPVIWLNINLGMTVRVFLKEINIWTNRRSEAGCPSKCGHCMPSSCNPLKAWIEQKAEEERIWFSPAFRHRLRLEFKLLAFLALRPLDSDWNYMITSPESPACCWWLVLDISASTTVWANSW